MTNPIPVTDRKPGDIISSDDIDAIAFVATRADTNAKAAQETAAAAVETAQGAYTVPAEGPPWLEQDGTVLRITAVESSQLPASKDAATIYLELA